MKVCTDLKSGRLSSENIAQNFCDVQESVTLSNIENMTSQCLYCYDAPCVEACPTGIRVPEFIRRISTGNIKGAALEILEKNPLGGTCARVCPVESLCEGACVKNKLNQHSVPIGALQRFAVDSVLNESKPLFSPKKPSGKKVAVVGSGPAGLTCAHKLALNGHKIVIFEARSKAGGLNEYGIAKYKMTDDWAQKELELICQAGEIEILYGKTLGVDVQLQFIRQEFDAVFLSIGLGSANEWGLENSALPGVYNAVDFIARIRQTSDLHTLEVGRRVIVIGGGSTSLDIACQIKKLGAQRVTVCYRKSKHDMPASEKEQQFVEKHQVIIKTCVNPISLKGSSGGVEAVRFEYTQRGQDGKWYGIGEYFEEPADMVFKAIGQQLDIDSNGVLKSCPEVQTEGGRIRVSANRETSLDGVFAGGDCIGLSSDLTVAAVEDGKIAAQSIHSRLMQGDQNNG